MMQPVWIAAGGLALTLGVVGVFLPLLPTVPFLLLSAFCFGRGSSRLHRSLLQHRVFGPPIEDWIESGAISRGAKKLATVSILATFGVSLSLGVGGEFLIVQAVALGGVVLFILTRPDA